jgi:hypothetical protein
MPGPSQDFYERAERAHYSFLDRTHDERPGLGKRLYHVALALAWAAAFFWAFKGISLAIKGPEDFALMMLPLEQIGGLGAFLGGMDALTVFLADLVYPMVASPTGILD